MLEKKAKEDINSLIQNAKKQGNKINLSTIMISVRFNPDDFADVLTIFDDNDIEVINEDVEPDSEEEIIAGDIMVSPFDPTKIDIKMDRITVDSIVKRIRNDELEFDSSFQRKAGLWKDIQKSQLIESLLLRIPLPAFYFDANNEDKLQIIDGLQRIGTIKEYVVEESFALKGLEFLRDFEGLKFSKLPRSMQRRIEETNLNAYFVNPSTPTNVKFNIFKRINTGGLVLTAQEIRNALFQGQATEFLLEMSKNQDFISATARSIKSERMLDREFCLRYVVTTQIGFEDYDGNFENYLNSGMEYLGKASQSELDDVRKSFSYCMKRNGELFGTFAFRRLNAEQRRGPINKALFEVWSYVLTKMSDEDFILLKSKKNDFMKEYMKLCNDYFFVNDIKSTDRNSLKNKFIKVQSLVEKVIRGESNVEEGND